MRAQSRDVIRSESARFRQKSVRVPQPPLHACIRQHASAYVSIRQHTSAHVSIRQHTSAYVSTRQNTSAYVSIRQHAHLLAGWMGQDEADEAGHRSTRVTGELCPLARLERVKCLEPVPRGVLQALPHSLSAGMRQQTSACVSRRQHTSAYGGHCKHCPIACQQACVSRRQHTHCTHCASAGAVAICRDRDGVC
jgi:hypothetical protein